MTQKATFYLFSPLLVAALGLFTWWVLRAPNPKTPKARGERLMEQQGCRSCHQPKNPFRAPLLEGVYGKIREFQDGSKAKADEAYLLESLTEPKKRVVKGYQATMPSYRHLSTDQLKSLVTYLKEGNEPL